MRLDSPNSPPPTTPVARTTTVVPLQNIPLRKPSAARPGEVASFGRAMAKAGASKDSSRTEHSDGDKDDQDIFSTAYAEVDAPVMAFVHPGFMSDSNGQSDSHSSEEEQNSENELTDEAIDAVAPVSSDADMNRDMAGFGGEAGDDDKRDSTPEEERAEMFDRLIDDLLGVDVECVIEPVQFDFLAQKNEQPSGGRGVVGEASQSDLPMVERMDTPPARRGQFRDDDTPDEDDVGAESGDAALGGRLDAAEEPAAGEMAKSHIDQDKRARDNADPDGDGGSINTGRPSKSDQAVTVANEGLSLAEAISEGAHHFQLLGNTTPIQSVEIVQHLNGQVSANVVVIQEYAGGLAEMMNRMRGRLSRYKVSLFRLYVGDQMVGEARMDPQVHDESKHDSDE